MALSMETRLDLQIQKTDQGFAFSSTYISKHIGGIALMHLNWNTLLTQDFKGPARVHFLHKAPGPIAYNDLIPSERPRHICQTHTFCNLTL